MAKTYFISDIHLCHKNILLFNREQHDIWKQNGYDIHNESESLNSPEEWNEFIVEKWNSVVSPEDEVFHLGDLGLGNQEEILKCLKRLNGRKHNITGNHDAKISTERLLECGFVENVPYKKLHINGRVVILSHFPIYDFEQSEHNAVHLYGHVHDIYNHHMNIKKIEEMDLIANTGLKPQMYCACVQMPYMDWAPKTLEEIISGSKKFYEEKAWK